MSMSNKSAELAELKVLRQHLKTWDAAQREVQSCEDKIRYLQNNKVEPHIRQAPTDRYQKECEKYIAEQQKKKSATIGKFMKIAVALLLILGICWLCLSGIFVKDTYLHTPEIVKQYYGEYVTSSGTRLKARLTISSCSDKGAIEGTFEFYNDTKNDNSSVYGKYTIQGKVITKSREGYVNATLKFKEWIDQPHGYSPLKDMQIKIYDNYQSIRAFEYNMSLYASDYKKPAKVNDLNTPEIIGSYSGDFWPNTGKKGTTTVTINSCDANGRVTGLFDYSFNGSKGQWEVSGQITEKYDNGSVKLTLKPTKQVFNNYMFYYPSTMEVEIYNDFRSLDSVEGMHCFYEDEGFTENPDPVKKPVQTAVNKAAPIVFPAYIAVVLVVLIILASKSTSSFTPQQQSKLDELQKQDHANKLTNENAYNQGLVQAERNQRAEIAQYKRRLEDAKQRVQECAYQCRQMRILADEDKTLANVEFLIQKLESGRADSLKEALNLMDEDARHRRESWMRTEIAHQEAMQRARAAAEARADQIYHNMKVEYQQRRQADELEKIRKALEE